MKWKIFLVICVLLSVGVVQAEVLDKCQNYNGGRYKTVRIATSPTAISLRNVPVGSVMASSSTPVENTVYLCGKTPADIQEEYSISEGVLAEGFTNVYQTGILGVGVRVIDHTFNKPIPYVKKFRGDGRHLSSISRIKIEYVRTSRKVSTGKAAMDFTIQYHLNYWSAQEIKFSGSTDLQSEEYFSGCTGVEKLNIPMGRVTMSNFKAGRKQFNLDVLCSGMMAGTKVPVKVYFEGDSDGTGRLNLEPGGATGVELLLLASENSMKLPFSSGIAIAMDWIRSEPKGEIYRLSVFAEYAKKDSQNVTPGKANATLNYILEYN